MLLHLRLILKNDSVSIAHGSISPRDLREKVFLSAAPQRYYDICGAIAPEGKLALLSITLTTR